MFLTTTLHLLNHRAAHSPDRVAMRTPGGETWTFRELRASALGIATRLRAEADGSRFAIVMPNGSALTLGILGATLAGTAMPLDPAHPREAFRAYLERLAATGLLVDGAQPAAEAAAAELSIPVIRFANGGQRDAVGAEFTASDDDIALVLMTSGSTGRPKLVPLSHRNLCVSAAEVAESIALRDTDVCLSMWELHHIGGLVDLLLAPIVSGGTILCTPGFDAASFFALLREHRPTWFQAVPTALHEIVARARRGEHDLGGHSLRLIRSVAARLPESLRADVEDLFGVPVVQTYGMTEAGPLITSTRLPPASPRQGSVGPSCGTAIRIVGGDGQELPVGEMGEIAIRGDNVFAGYEDDPEENQARFAEGWFLTGDLGRLDTGGHLFLAGRSKQLINRGGETINPAEVEDALRRHDAVHDAVAFPVEHRTLGEDVAAAVVLVPGRTCSPSELEALAAEHLAAFKVPKRLLFVDALPLTAIGKPDRPELARMAAKQPPDATPIASAADDLERELAAIWARELEIEAIAPDENFFAAGGDSLVGVRLLAAVEAWRGSPLPDALLFEISTVRQMAAQLRADGMGATSDEQVAGAAGELDSDLVRRIRRVMSAGQVPPMKGWPTVKAPAHEEGGADETPPLYWCFNAPDLEMSALLGVWSGPDTILGLYSGEDGGPETNASIAEHYCDVIRRRTGDRPFYLGGNCRGARVAERMLLSLRNAGTPPRGAILMEYGSDAVATMDLPILFLFGESSRVPKKEQMRFRSMARKRRSFVQVANMRGSHGHFFDPENVESLHGRIRDFLEIQRAP